MPTLDWRVSEYTSALLKYCVWLTLHRNGMAIMPMTPSVMSGRAMDSLERPCTSLLVLWPLRFLLGQNSFTPMVAMKNMFKVRQTRLRMSTPIDTHTADRVNLKLDRPSTENPN